MPQIKTPLKDLFNMFADSAADEKLEMPVRRLAAKQTILVAHMMRIETIVASLLKAGQNLEKKHDESANTLAENILAIQKHLGIAPAAPATEQPTTEGAPMSEEDEAVAMAEKVMAETEAEVAKLKSGPTNGADKIAAVTPIKPAADRATGDVS